MKIVFILPNGSKYSVESDVNKSLATAFGKLLDENPNIMKNIKYGGCFIEDKEVELYENIQDLQIDENKEIIIKNKNEFSNNICINEIKNNPLNLKLQEIEDQGFYFGQFMNGKREGIGTLFLNNGGQIYTGEWKNDSPNGFGYNYLGNGNFYVGEVVDIIREGRGLFKWKNCDIYDGEWKNGVQNGRGINFYGRGDFDGDVYFGEFFNGQKHGKGTYKYSNGKIKNGIWKNDKL